MWDAIYAGVYARVWRPIGQHEDEREYNLTVDEIDRVAADAANDAIQRHDRDGWRYPK